MAIALDPHTNSQLVGWLERDDIRVERHPDGTILGIDGTGFARLSDPASTEGAAALAVETRDLSLSVIRGPVAAVRAFVVNRRDPWQQIIEGTEMASIGPASPRMVPGSLEPAAGELPDWRAAFIAEAFADGGTPPVVPLDQLFVWSVDGAPRCMAGLIPVNRTASRIVTVYTPPHERGRGYAGALAGALVDRARRAGLELVTLDVSVIDPRARRAYERAGFRAVGHNAVWIRVD